MKAKRIPKAELPAIVQALNNLVAKRGGVDGILIGDFAKQGLKPEIAQQIEAIVFGLDVMEPSVDRVMREVKKHTAG